MKPDKYIILLLLFCFTYLHLWSQAKSYTLDSNHSGQTKAYVARDYIELNPGFTFEASAGNSFTGEIDPALLFPPHEGSYITPDGTLTESPLEGSAVGSIPGQFAVSPTGGATYTIPIDIPAGINGMQPNISLVYNSQSGNGIAGWGWNLSGMSAITVGAKTIFSDSAVSGINLDKKESYYLDGNRLFIKSGTYGTINAEYETENRIYLKIKQTGTAWNLYPSKFTVTSKDGTVTEYAQAVNPKGSSHPARWLVSKVTDSNGNYINYKYKSNSTATQTVLDYIEYTGDTGVSPASKIEFGYGENNSEKHYISGYLFEDHHLLKTITITCNTAQIRKYSFTHEYRDRKHFLTAVELEGENGEKLPVTAIEWSEDNKIMETKNAGVPKILYLIPTSNHRFFAADFSGDGVSDLIRIFRNKDTQSDYAHFNKINEDGSFDATYTIAFDNVVSWSDFIRYQGSSLIANFGVNNKTFILPQYQEINSNREVVFNLYQQINKWVQNPVKISRPLSYSAMPAYTVADFNNDGKDEIVYIEQFINKRIPTTSVLLSNFPAKILYNKGEVLTQSNANFGTSSCKIIEENLLAGESAKYKYWGYTTHLFAFDFNSDGLKDILSIAYGHWQIFKNNGGTMGSDGVVRVTFSDVSPNTDNDVVFGRVKTGDFNGDGLMDFITYTSSYTYMYIADGNLGFTKQDISDIVNITFNDSDSDKDDLIVTDFDYNGKSDIISVNANYNNGYKSTDIRWYISNGTSFTENKQFNLTDENYYYRGYTATGDFDGDGKEDLFCYNGDISQWDQNPASNAYIYRAFNTGFSGNLVTGVTDGLGIKTSINYRPLTYPETEKPGADIYGVEYFYIKDTIAHPASLFTVDIQAPLYCVSSVSDPVSTTKYSYGSLKGNVKGKGVLGFTTTSTYDTVSKHITVTSITMNYDYCLPEKTKTVTFSPLEAGGVEVAEAAEVENTFNTVKTGKIYTTGLSKTVENDYVTAFRKMTEYKYDDYGNLLVLCTSQGVLSKTDSVTYIQAGSSSWCPNKPSSVHTVSSYQDMRDTVVKAFEYDSHGNLTKEILHPGKAPFRVETVYANYDLFGHARSVSVKAKDASGVEQTRTTSQTFTPSGRFAASKTDALGQTTAYSWDETRGLLTSETDPWGRATTYGYDSWGNLLETRRPDGNRHTAVLRWAGSGAPAGAKYYRYEQTSGNAPALTWFDGLAREIRRDTRGLNDREIYVSTEYYTSGANTGKIYRVSEPYFAGDSKTWAVTYNTFDSYGRNTKLTTPAGITTTVYDGFTTTVTTPEGTKSTTVNSSGLTASSAVNGKTVGYTYYPNGLTKTATPDGGQPIAMEYNPHGKRTKLTDPDAGVIETRYNGFGETVEERQKIHNAANWNVTTNNYSPAGLLQSTVRGSETTAYTYDGDLGHPARIKSIEIAGQHRQSFTYDNLGRITGLREEIDNKTLNRSTEYDALGRIKRETYPTGYYSENHYDSNGILTKTTDSRNRRVWELTGENARGQITEEKKGNLTTTYGYDTYGLPASITAPGILNIVTGFDAKGNLVYRSNTAATPGYESFKYDGLNRLTEWKWNVAGGFTRNTVYSSGGNITRKDDLHPGYTLHYGANSKPHALTSITGVDYNDVWSRIPSLNMKAEYTDFNKIKRLVERDLDQYGNSYCSDDEECSVGEYIFTYGVDGQRRKMEAKHGPGYNTTYYFGNYEELCNSGGAVLKKIHYLRGAIYIDNTSGADEFYYTYTDYLGSLTALVNEQGQAVERYAYSPWGERINPSNLSMRDTRYLKLTRGYTMHEHLDWFGVINMNGRVYDPLTAMFFSPDPFVTYPNDWLNYNRYLYGLGNPFKYTDPSGENPLIIAMAVGLWINITMQSMQGNIDNAGDFWLAAGVGALSGLVGGAAGASVSSALGSTGAIAGFASGAVGGTAGGFVSGAGNAWLLGDASFEDGFMSGLKSAGIGALTGGIIGGISGGINAVKDGGNFWTGKGATFNSVLPSGDKNTVTVGEGMEYTTEYAKTFSDENFGQIKNLDNLYADGSIPKGYTNKGEYVYNIKGQKVGGTTVYNGIGKGSDVYLYKTAFTSRERLYLIMGHEYLHVHFNAAGYAGSKRAQDRAAYEWNMDQAKAWNMSTTHYESHYKALYSKFMYPVLDYRKAGFYILNIRPW